MRALYHQKAREFLEDSIAKLEKPSKNEADEKDLATAKFKAIRLKYLCKCYEALAHLLCDPYLFDQGEVYINKADEIYKENTDLLDQDLYRRFLLKKASFLKKYGFFQ